MPTVLKRLARPVAAIALPFLLGSCGLGGPAYAPTSVADAVIEMTNNLSFSPGTVHIKAGQTAEWRNKSFFTHTVTDDPALARDPAHATLPAGAQAFSQEVPPGQIFQHRFTVPGTYHYFCRPHEGSGMLGEVIVDPAV